MARERLTQDTIATKPDPAVVSATVKAIKSGKPLPKQPKTVIDPFVVPVVAPTVTPVTPAPMTHTPDPASVTSNPVITTDPVVSAQLTELQRKYEDLLNGQAQDAETLRLNREAEKKQKRDSIVDIMRNRFKQYGLESLSDTILKLAQDGASEDTITFALQETDTYKQRFKANDARIKAGLSVLSPAEYLNLEDSYRQVLRASGLNQFDNDNYVSQFIANDMSANELASRVQLATQRVQNEDPSVLKQLGDYYGITATDLVSTALDPKQQSSILQNKITAAEIGAAGVRQGFGVKAATAEQLALQGVTQEQAQRGYSTIGDVLPTASKLSGIYGNTLDAYDQATAEQEVFGGLASAKRKRERLTGREQATFAGSSGTLGASYGTPRSSFNKAPAGQI